MRFLLPLLLAAPAHAHVGHIGEVAGHDHWVAGAAIGVAAAITLWGVLKGKKKSEEPEEEVEETEEAEA